jgi:hypothetical protein
MNNEFKRKISMNEILQQESSFYGFCSEVVTMQT